MPKKYEIDNQSIDFGAFALILIDGYMYIITVKVTSIEGKKKRLALCLQIDVKVTKPKETRRRNRKNENN